MTRALSILRATRGGPLARMGRYHPYARYANRALTAYRYGRMGYRYGRGIYRAARGAYRAKRKLSRMRMARAKRRKMTSVGHRVGTSNAKRVQDNTPLVTINPEVLYSVQLLNIVKQATTAPNELNRRRTDTVNFRGIKFCVNARAEGALGTAIAWVNIAIISPRSDLTSASPIPNAEFFRNPTGDSRDIAFNDASLDNMDYDCVAINTDKYTVHKRIKFKIGPAQSTEGRRESSLEWYMKINRQIRYEEGNQFPEGKNMYMVWWFSTSDGGTPNNSIRFQYNFVKYFRETLGQ